MLQVGPYPFILENRCTCRIPMSDFRGAGQFLWLRFPQATGPWRTLRDPIRLAAGDGIHACGWAGERIVDPGFDQFRLGVQLSYDPSTLIDHDVSWLLFVGCTGGGSPPGPPETKESTGVEVQRTQWVSGQTPDYDSIAPAAFAASFRFPAGGTGAVAESLWGSAGKDPF